MVNATTTQQMILSQLKTQGGELKEIKESLKTLVSLEEKQLADRRRIDGIEEESKELRKEINDLKIASAQDTGKQAVIWPVFEKIIPVLILAGIVFLASGGKLHAASVESYFRAGFGVHPDFTENLPKGWGTSDYNDRIIGHFALGIRKPNMIDRWDAFAEMEHVSDPRWADPGAGLNWIKIGLEKSW